MSSRVIAVDPGKVTGIAYRDSFNRLQYGEIANPLHVVYLCEDYDHIVCEDFEISARTIRTAVEYTALRIIGYLELKCRQTGQDFILQRPAHKRFASDDVLKRLDWYRPTPDGHANDAIRHLVYYLLRHRDPVVMQVLWEEYRDDREL